MVRSYRKTGSPKSAKFYPFFAFEVTVRQARQNRLSFTPFLHSRTTIKAALINRRASLSLATIKAQRNQVSSPGETTAVAHGGNHGSRSWGRPRQSLMGETTAVAHGGDHGSRLWGRPRQSLMGETPKTALPSQDHAAFPRPRCLPKTALPSQDRAALLFPVP